MEIFFSSGYGFLFIVASNLVFALVGEISLQMISMLLFYSSKLSVLADAMHFILSTMNT